MFFFRLYPGLELSFGHNIARKILFLNAYFCWGSKVFYVSWTKNLYWIEPLVMVTYSWSSYFVISKDLDYMKDNMMLLEQ